MRENGEGILTETGKRQKYHNQRKKKGVNE